MNRLLFFFQSTTNGTVLSKNKFVVTNLFPNFFNPHIVNKVEVEIHMVLIAMKKCNLGEEKFSNPEMNVWIEKWDLGIKYLDKNFGTHIGNQKMKKSCAMNVCDLWSQLF